MSSRDHIEGLMAASLYEPLSPEEARELEAWMAAHPEDRAELQELQAFVAAIPATVPEYAGDLRPILREEIRRGALTRWNWSMAPRYLLQFAGVAAVTALLAVPIFQGMRMGLTNDLGEQLAGMANLDVMSRAGQLLAAGDYTQTHALLSQQLAANPQDPQAGQWQQLLARLEFDHFNRYAEAYAAYGDLRAKYGEVFAASPDNAYRYDLLEQTRDDNFDPLYVIASARQEGMQAFDDLEAVVAKYSGRSNAVAELALERMKDVAGTLEGPSPVFRMAAYEQLRNKCDDPTAIAKLSERLGQLYLTHNGDTARARELLQEAVECADGPLAQQAMVSLASLR